eukprot:1186803-Rhodomonas_salina.1
MEESPVEEHWAVPVQGYVLRPLKPLHFFRPAPVSSVYYPRIPQIQPGIQPPFFKSFALRRQGQALHAAYLPRYALRPVVGTYEAQPGMYAAAMASASGGVAVGPSAAGESFVEHMMPGSSGAQAGAQ